MSEEDEIAKLIAQLKSEDENARGNAVWLLGRMCKKAAAAAPELIERLKDEVACVRRDAAEALGKIKAMEAVPPLIAALKDPDATVRRVAAAALSELGSVEAVPPLIELLKDKNKDVRYRAAAALSELGSVEAVPTLIEALGSGRLNEVPVWAAEALVGIGAPAVPALVEALGDENVKLRCNALWSLCKMGAKATEAGPAFVEAVPALVKLLGDEDRTVHINAGEMLERLGVSAIPAIIHAAHRYPELHEAVNRVVEMIARKSERPSGVRRVDRRPKEFSQVPRAMTLGVGARPQVVRLGR